MSEAIQVFVLTHCARADLFYGAAMIFETLRVGFPNARIKVFDNGSGIEFRLRIERLARENDCAFEAIAGPGLTHSEYIDARIEAAARDAGCRGPVVLLDPDVCLWRSCEDFDFDGLMAGRLIAAFDDPVTGCVTMPRLHSSFLWIPEAARLHGRICDVRARRFDFEPFAPISAKLGDVWLRFDTGAGVYAALGDECVSFVPHHLDHYDHIFCGTHLERLVAAMPANVRAVMERSHELAKRGQLHALRGLWREQDRVWEEAFGDRGEPGSGGQCDSG